MPAFLGVLIARASRQDDGVSGNIALFKLAVDSNLPAASQAVSEAAGTARKAPAATAPPTGEGPATGDKPAAALNGAPLTTTVAMRVVLASGEQLERHFNLQLPLLFPPEAGQASTEPADVFQSKDVRKAVALWYYTVKARQLLSTRRGSRGLQRGIAAFKSYFETAARECGDEKKMLAEVSLWDQLVDVKIEALAKNRRESSLCVVM